MANYSKKQVTMKTDGNGALISLVAMLFLGVTLLSQPAAGWADPTDLGVFFSGNVFGELEPCGG
jgi:hypothetical protein